MTTRTRMNVYFDPDLLKQVEAVARRRNVSKSAIIEAAVASFLSGDSAEKLEAAMLGGITATRVPTTDARTEGRTDHARHPTGGTEQLRRRRSLRFR